MEVVVTKDQLEKARACRVYLDSPNWDHGREALVYPDWAEAVRRLLSTRAGVTHLDFLVASALVPMTRDEFKAAREAKRSGGG